MDRGIYDFICRLGLSEFITISNPTAIHISSYAQVINRDFTIDDVERLICVKILKSDAFSGVDCHADDGKVSLHIRNGDYLLPSKHGYHDCFDRMEYLNKAINHNGLDGIDHVVVFSDDLPLCRGKYNDILSRRFKTVEYNEETVFEKEFVRLSLFKNRINWNSTFSFWTSFIGNVVHDHSGATICPSRFDKNDGIETRIDPRWTVV